MKKLYCFRGRSIFKTQRLILPLIVLISLLLNAKILPAQVSVVSGFTPNQYVGYLVGSGITYSNVTYTCNNNAIGYFSSGATPTTLGIGSGVLLSTGRVNGTPAIGASASSFVSSATNCGGDAQLQALIPSYSITEATILQFDFVPISDTIKFEYVFASEEYHEWVNSGYNDVFGFFLSGPNPLGGNYVNKNLALIPGTSTPVAINTVNNGNTSNACSSGPCENCAFFVDNCNQSGLVFDALTGVLTAWAVVVPCQTYHIKLAVGDAGDRIYDSGVFLKEHSFSSPTLSYSTSYPMATALGNYSIEGGCNNASVTFSLPAPQSTDYIVHYTLSGTATYGSDYSFPLSVTIPAGSTSVTAVLNGTWDGIAEGNETVVLTIQTSVCNSETLTLDIRDYNNIVLTHPNSPSVCQGNSANISVNVANGQPPFTYIWNNGVTSNSQTVTPLSSTSYSVTVTDLCGNTATSSVLVTVNPNPNISITPSDNNICIGESVSLEATSSVVGTSYTWSNGSTGSVISVSPNTSTVYSVTGSTPSGCSASSQVSINVNPNPVITVNPQSSGFCVGGSTTLTASGAANYQWLPLSGLSSGNGASVVASPSATTTYTVTGTDANGCQSTASASVVVSPMPLVDAGSNQTICQGESVTLNGSGAWIYNWSPSATLNNPNIANPIATPLVTTTYYLSGSSPGQNVINNGNFENGNVGFSTNYVYSNNLFPEGNYVITNNPNNHHTNFSACTDHTPAPGNNMMVVNGAPIPGQHVWCQTIAVVPNTTYAFSTWITSVHPSNPAILQFSVNGSLLGTPFTAPSTTCTWAQFYQTWYSGANTSIDICIVNQNTIAAGNDFALDDISFAPLCYNEDSVTIFVNPIPVLSINSATICNGENATLSVSSTVPGTTYVWSNGSIGNSITVSPSVSTTYSVTGTASGCTGTASATVTVNPNPVLSVTSTAASLCEGASAIINVGSSIPGTTYLWSNGSTNSTITVSPTTTTTYNVTGTTASGCSTTASISITVNPLPSLSLTVTDNEICTGETVILNANSSIIGSIFSWSNGSNGNSINVSPSTTTNYSVTASSPQGCTASAQTTIIVNPNPVLSISSSDPVLCNGESTNINVTSTIAGTSFAWNNGMSGSSITVNPNTNTTYTVTGTTALGCTASASINIVVNPLPVLTITNPNTSLCLGESGTLSASSNIPGSNFHWSNGSNSASITVTPNSSTIYMLTVSSPEGCVSTGQTSITVRPLPILTLTSSATEICDGGSATISVGSSITGTTFLWNTGSTSNSILVSPNSTSSYTVTGTSPLGCTNTATISIEVNPLPDITLNVSDNEICVGESSTISVVSSIAGSTFLWNTGATTNSITVSPTTSSLYSVTVSTPDGCTAIAQTNIIVNPLPVLTITTSSDEICAGATATISVSSSINGTSFLWSNGSTNSTINVSPGSTSSYSVTASSPQGCVSESVANIVVNPLPLVSINSTDNEICVGEQSTLSASSNIVGSTFLWNDGQTSSSVTVSPVTTSTYSLTVTSPDGCTSTAQSTIVVNPLPVLTLNYSSTEICFGNSAHISVESNIPGTTFIWNTGETHSTINVSPGSTTVYTVTGTSPNACASIVSGTIIVNPLPIVTVTASDAEICLGESTIISAISNIPGSTFLWSNGSTDASFSVSPLNTTIYSVVVTSPDGCMSNGQIEVIVNPLPSLTLTATDPIICDNETTQITVSSSLPGTVYQWSTGESGSVITVNPDNTTIYSITGTSTSGCVTIANATITVNPTPNINITTSAASICLGDSSTINATSTIAGSTFLWSNGSSESQMMLSPTSSTIYMLTVTSPEGCVSTGQTSINVRPLPELTIIASENQICTGDTTTISVSSSLNNTSFVWSTGSMASQILVSPSSNTTYSVTGTSLSGCSSSTNISIVVNPLPILSLSTSDNEICIGETVEFTISSNIPGSQFLWNNGLTESHFTLNPIVTSSYTVTATSPQGCVSTSSSQVIVNPLPELSITSSSNEICNGASATINVSSSINGTTFLWNNGSVSNELLVSPSVNTEYSVTGTSPEGCVNLSSINIEVLPLPTISISASDAELCMGQSSTIEASCNLPGVNFNWSNGETSATIIVSPTTSTTYTVTAISADGCSNTSSISIVVNPLPILSIQASSVEICNGASAQISVSSNILNTSYLWSNGSTANTISVSPGATSDYYVTGTSPEGCSTIISQAIEVNPLPMVTITANDSEICQGENVTLTVSTDIAGSTFLWNTGSEGNQILVSPENSTNYSVTVSSPEGCIADALLPITVNQNPVLTIIPSSAAICIGSNATLSAETNIPVIQYSWSNGMNTESIIVNPQETATYGLTVTTSNGCSAIGSYTLQVNELPDLTLSPEDLEICMGNSTQLVVTSNHQLSSIEWSTGENTVSILVSPTQSTIYSVTAADVNGCVSNAEYNLMVNPNPIVHVTPNQPNICSGASITLVASSDISGTSFAWSNGSVTNPIIVQPTQTTTYNVTGTSPKGCTGTSRATVQVNPAPTFVVHPSMSWICPGDTVQISANSPDPLSYLWSNGSDDDYIMVSPSQTTTYSVTGTSIYGCETSASMIINVRNSPTITVVPENPKICQGDDVELTASGAVLYDWSPGVGLNTTVGPIVTANPETTTTYLVQGVDLFGCRATTEVTVFIAPVPNINFTASETNICKMTVVHFSGTCDLSTSSWQWDFGDPASGQSNGSSYQNPMHTYFETGSYTVGLTVTTTDGCVKNIKKPSFITVHPNPIANFVRTPDITTMENPKIQFFNQSLGATKFLWNFDDPESGYNNISVLENPVHVYAGEGEYWATLYTENEWGCVDSISNRIIINPKWQEYIPTAFTPNGDGDNDIFRPYGFNIDYSDYSMFVYDRWGKQIFETHDINVGWDGRVNDHEEVAMQDVYVYLIVLRDINGLEHQFIGHITLIK